MNNWRMEELGDLLSSVMRGASLAGKFYSDEGSLIRLTLKNFRYPDNGFKENKSKDDIYYIGDIDNRYILHKGDIITPLTDLTQREIGLFGTTAIIPEDNKYILSGDMAVLKNNQLKIDSRFLYYLLPLDYVKKQLSAGGKKTNVRHISLDKIKECIVYIPEIKVQQKIGDFLSIIDQLIENNQSKIALLEKLIKKIYYYWFIQFDFPNEDGKPYKSSGGKMVWNIRINREIPYDFSVNSILDCGVIVTDYTANGSFEGLAKNVKYYKSKNYAQLIRITDAIKNFSNNNNIYIDRRGYEYLKTCQLQGDEIIICNVGKVGYVFRCPHLNIKMALGPNGIIVKGGELDNYLFQYFSSQIGISQIKSIVSGSVQPKFNKTDFRNILIPVPSKQLLNQFNLLYNSIYNCIKNIQHEQSLLSDLKMFLLPLLMNGQVSFNKI